jgi:hypothetical protein
MLTSVDHISTKCLTRKPMETLQKYGGAGDKRQRYLADLTTRRQSVPSKALYSLTWRWIVEYDGIFVSFFVGRGMGIITSSCSPDDGN